jgi:hypothetical protein
LAVLAMKPCTLPGVAPDAFAAWHMICTVAPKLSSQPSQPW